MRKVGYYAIDTRTATPLEPRYFLLALGVVLAVNSLRLHWKRQRGERAYYDGQGSPVTRFDVLLSGVLSVLAFGACVIEWWRTR